MKKTVKILLTVSVILLIFPLSVWISRLADRPVDQELRDSKTASSFIDLSKGPVEYRIDGLKEGETLILVSGFSVPFYCWDPVVEELSDQYRIIRYNHYGRGLSARPRDRHTLDLFVTQLKDVIEELGGNGPIHLAGLSMGGWISAAYGAEYPENLKSLTLIAPSGYPVEESFSSRLVKFPVLGDFIMTLFGDPILSGRNASNLKQPEKYPEFQTQFEEQLKLRGFKEALLSTLRYSGFTSTPEVFASLGEHRLPILLVWGEQDGVIPYPLHQEILKELPGAEFHSIEGAGHNVQYEKPEAVIPLMRQFMLNSHFE